MVGSIDPRCEQSRGTHWLNKVAWLIGTRVAEAILASGLTSCIDRPDIWMQAIRSDLTKLLCHGGRPHMGPGAEAGTTASGLIQFSNSQLRRCERSEAIQFSPSQRSGLLRCARN